MEYKLRRVEKGEKIWIGSKNGRQIRKYTVKEYDEETVT